MLLLAILSIMAIDGVVTMNPGPVDKKAVGQKGRRTKRPGDGKACLF